MAYEPPDIKNAPPGWQTGDPIPPGYEGSEINAANLKAWLKGAHDQAAANAPGAAPDANATTKGLVRLAGALGGTADAPTVPGLAGKADSTDPRLTDQRVPTDGSVTAAKVAASLKPSGTAAAETEALRALGGTANTAAAGNDSRFPTAGEKAALGAAQGTLGTANPLVSLAAMTAGLSDVIQNSDGTWPARPTINGAAVPWALRWRSWPGRTETPQAKMAEYDSFLPIPAAA